ncbi:PIN domain-containing protein [candidate division KSB1 bacterium]|nr:PIN domain-containing protein [candidate division KSB1 bacterium]
MDTGFLLAVLDADDHMHEACVEALLQEPAPLLPEAVLPQLAYMVLRELGYETLSNFLRALSRGEMTIERTTSADLSRAAEILEKYADSGIDFVDSVIMVIAERLKIKRIFTLDQRHFGLMRPKHCPAFDITP